MLYTTETVSLQGGITWVHYHPAWKFNLLSQHSVQFLINQLVSPGLAVHTFRADRTNCRSKFHHREHIERQPSEGTDMSFYEQIG